MVAGAMGRGILSALLAFVLMAVHAAFVAFIKVLFAHYS
jgi:hypothetical protein